MNLRLRWKIMTFTVLPLVTLTLATLWIVNWSITRQVQQGIREDLRRASAVLDNVLDSRAQSLAIGGQMTAKDPKFFSVLTIPGSHKDPQLRATVAGVARDFNVITQADLFEVTNADGQLLAAVGRDASTARVREPLVREALAGRAVSGILAEPDAHYQVSVATVYAGGRPVGALLLGARIGAELAERLRELTRSQVTFVSRDAITGSTLESAEERESVLSAIGGLASATPAPARAGTLLELRGGGHRHLTLIRSLPPGDPKTGQFYVMQRAIDEETAFLREMQAVLVGLGVTAVMVALLAGLVIAERITAPVQRLVRGAEEMERGNYDFPLAVASRDEIGELASKFDEMRRRQRDYVRHLREAARVKSEFISVASHELRTPISVIRGFLELMQQSKLGPITQQQRQALDATDRSVTTLIRIAEDATRIAEIDGKSLSLKHADCSVAGIVTQAVFEVRSRAVGRKVALSWAPQAGLGNAYVDGGSLVQALVHVISNAVRFTPDGGRVEVRAAINGEHVVFSVMDNGVGIEPDHQRRLSEQPIAVLDSLQHHSSSTLEFNSAGLGLGLQIARGVAEAHGGKLVIESRPGVGTTVTLWIPVEAAAQLEAAA